MFNEKIIKVREMGFVGLNQAYGRIKQLPCFLIKFIKVENCQFQFSIPKNNNKIKIKNPIPYSVHKSKTLQRSDLGESPTRVPVPLWGLHNKCWVENDAPQTIASIYRQICTIFGFDSCLVTQMLISPSATSRLIHFWYWV